MRLSVTRIKERCRSRGIGLGQLLSQAGVSRTAYYSLVRKSSILPKSVEALAAALDVFPSQLLAESSRLGRIRAIRHEVDRLLARHPDASREDVFHTLLLLEQEPLERLRRGLLRGRRSHLH